MKRDLVRVGIVGSKFAAGFHAESYALAPNCEVVAVCDLARPGRFMKKWGIRKYFRTPRAMYESGEVDLVSLCVPNYLHAPFIVEAARYKLGIVTEKPLATKLSDARKALAAVKKHGAPLYYAEDWVFAPAVRRTMALIKEGAIGRVYAVEAHETHNGSHSPFAKTVEYCGGGAFIHLAIHPIDFVRLVSKSECAEVTAMMTGGRKQNFEHRDFEGEDWSAVVMRMRSGVRAIVKGNYVTHGGMDDRVEIYGSEGNIKIDMTMGSMLSVYSRNGFAYALEKAETTRGWTRPAVDEFYNLGYHAEMAHFVECFRTGRKPEKGVRGEDGLRCLEIVDAAYRSARTGQTVKL